MILVPLALGVVIIGGPLFVAVVLAAALLAVLEWVRMAVPPEAVGRSVALSGGAVMVVTLVSLALEPWPAVVLAVALALILALVPAAGSGRVRDRDRWAVALSVPYVGISCVSVIWLRDGAGVGPGLVLFLFFTIWANDSAAFGVGRGIGGPKLAPAISPKKTWAGFYGGTIAGALAGLAWALLAGAHAPWIALGMGALLAVVGQAGDLFESALKRRYKQKDSGQLIPGHGGLLDRIDGLIAAAPVLALFQATAGTTLGWW